MTDLAKLKCDDVRSECAKMILSASGWRKIYALSGSENDGGIQISAADTVLSALAAAVFADFMLKKSSESPIIAVGIDARPTGPAIADAVLRVLLGKNVQVRYAGVVAAPEIMAYSRTLSGFLYISASHNPIGHNGIKFGLNDGGVLPAQESALLSDAFRRICADTSVIDIARGLLNADERLLSETYACSKECKAAAESAYYEFTKEVVSGSTEASAQNLVFDAVKSYAAAAKIGIVCDMNGSARTCSIDKRLFAETGIDFYSINDKPGQIVHGIIPELENLEFCADEMRRLRSAACKNIIAGYMPDCDGDRGNLVFWNEKTCRPEIPAAQEVFALSVLAELAFMKYSGFGGKTAVVVNDPTSMRVEDIAAVFGAEVFRAEVGEANVVNLARDVRSRGYAVRILGEGSNGGNITFPAAVRDPLNTLFAVIKLLAVRGENHSGCKNLFHLWLCLSGREHIYRDDFTMTDVLDSLPPYATTCVSEKRAVLKVKTADHSKLKQAYQHIFEQEWRRVRSDFAEKYGITGYTAIANNGTEERRNISDFGESKRGGLKILFTDAEGNNAAFIWMRGSGTEPVFRVLCDVRGENSAAEEQALLAWHTDMILRADALCSC
ncbi:MAG: hypothetical protein NC041_04980 [Bacteroides sp.]|nr:hypothetical protein [Prevotella sp.]MCM1407311.1 phosphoglucomutase [Treponema brennaborense]MCM1469801.1 hypothetical protein [Bacteroides sp.]